MAPLPFLFKTAGIGTCVRMGVHTCPSHPGNLQRSLHISLLNKNRSWTPTASIQKALLLLGMPYQYHTLIFLGLSPILTSIFLKNPR
jgi:hypothetical protein